MTILHAGGKFGGAGYAVSGGLHGVGISVVNALSTRVETVVKRDGFTWQQNFSDGGKPLGELQKGEPTDETGTSQTFWADPTIFETTEYDFETLRARFQQYAFLNKGLQISLTDERPEHLGTGDEVAGAGDEPTTARRRSGTSPTSTTTAWSTTSSTSTARRRSRSSTRRSSTSSPRTPSAGSPSRSRMQWTNAYSESVHTYANTISTTEGGTHEEGFRAAMTSLINRYARDKGILKEKDENLTGDDIREGLTAVISDQARRAAVRGPDEDEARQHRGQDVRAARGQRAARRLAGLAPERGARRHPQVDPGRGRPDGGPQGARGHAPQGSARVGRHAGQAPRLPVEPRRGVRGLHRRGRLGRRLRGPRAQPAHAGDPADPRQDPQRRAGAAGPGAGQPGGPGADHGLRHGHRRGLRPRPSCGTTRSCSWPTPTSTVSTSAPCC